MQWQTPRIYLPISLRLLTYLLSSVPTYADVASTEAGVDHNLALSLVAIANGCSFFGRTCIGADTSQGVLDYLTY